MDTTKIVFFDTDCLLSFLLINEEGLLCQHFNNGLYIPEPVYFELIKFTGMSLKVKSLIQAKKFVKYEIQLNSPEEQKYQELISIKKNRKIIGRGEASALSCAITLGAAIASNNLSDVSYYIDKYNLENYTTGRILIEIVKNGMVEFEYAFQMWERMKMAERTLPKIDFKEYFLENGKSK